MRTYIDNYVIYLVFYHFMLKLDNKTVWKQNNGLVPFCIILIFNLGTLHYFVC